MSDLYQRQCLNHATREAVARCPECGHFYCRECISEHDDRVICASCLRKMLRARETRHSPALSWLSRGLAFCLSLTLGWTAFYLVGKILLSLPADVHDGTLWSTSFWQE